MAVSRWARTMRRAFLVVAVAVGPTLIAAAPPVRAGTTGGIFDASGVDYDAACVTASVRPSSPNSVASPGALGWYCDAPAGVSTYHGSTEATDLRTVRLASNASGQFVATVVVDGAWPSPGSTNLLAFDTPNPGQFLGVRWRVLFQNKNVQTNIPTNPAGGCNRVPSGLVHDQHGSWRDGYHFFVGYAIDWDDTRWVHSAQVGVYDPSPGGGFRVTTLGTNTGSGWANADPNMVFGVNWSFTHTGPTDVTITVDGIVKQTSALCQQGFLKTEYGSPGQAIANVKGLSTVVQAPGPKPGATPCPPSSDDACQASGPTFAEADIVSDTTAGFSNTGSLGRNIADIAYTPGEDDSTDTKGNGPTCPYPTYGGTAPQNPMFTPDTACQVDDDASGRGTENAEFWETPFGFTF